MATPGSQARGSLVVALCIAAAAGCGGSDHKRVAAASRAVPLLGIVGEGRHAALARLDPRTLAPRSRRLRLGGFFAWPWAFSPAGDRVALAVSTRRGRTLVGCVDLRRWRVRRGPSLGRYAVAQAAAWPRADRLLVLYQLAGRPFRFAVAVIDPLAGRIVARRTLPARTRPWQVASSPAGLVLLLGPSAAVGPARLVAVGADGAPRAVALPDVQVGEELRRAGGRPLRTNVVLPALAVDDSGTRAFVIAARRPVVEVELAGGTVTRHAPSRPVSLLGRLRDWLEPPAEAKGFTGPTRFAAWLPGGKLALAGYDEGSPPRELTPTGLQLIDTATWRVRTVDRRAREFTVAGDALLVSSPIQDDRGRVRGVGLTAYGFDGTRRFHRFGRGYVARIAAAGRYAYASFYEPRHHTAVVDLRTGRVLRELPTARPPRLVVPPVPGGTSTTG